LTITSQATDDNLTRMGSARVRQLPPEIWNSLYLGWVRLASLGLVQYLKFCEQ